MGDLDGLWSVHRVGGLLPPMPGVVKEIHGTRGETRIGPLPGARFVVEGLALRYERPFSGFVDVLEAADVGYRGRATFRGRDFGRFELHPARPPPVVQPEKSDD